MHPAARPSAHPHPRLVVSIHSSSYITPAHRARRTTAAGGQNRNTFHCTTGAKAGKRTGKMSLRAPFRQAQKARCEHHMAGGTRSGWSMPVPPSFAQPPARELDLAQGSGALWGDKTMQCSGDTGPAQVALPAGTHALLFL